MQIPGVLEYQVLPLRPLHKWAYLKKSLLVTWVIKFYVMISIFFLRCKIQKWSNLKCNDLRVFPLSCIRDGTNALKKMIGRVQHLRLLIRHFQAMDGERRNSCVRVCVCGCGSEVNSASVVTGVAVIL